MYLDSAKTNLPSNAQSLFCQIQREIFIMATISKIHQKIDIVLLLQCVVVLNWHYKNISMKLNIENILWQREYNFTIWLIYQIWYLLLYLIKVDFILYEHAFEEQYESQWYDKFK